MAHDLNSMTTKQLRDLRDQIDARLPAAEAKAMQDARDKINALVVAAGFRLDEIFATKRKPAKRAAKARPVGKPKGWRDQTTGAIWCGRGRKPTGFDKSRAVAM